MRLKLNIGRISLACGESPVFCPVSKGIMATSIFPDNHVKIVGISAVM